MSTISDSTDLKITSICKEKKDIIFLSDTRLNTDIQISATENITKKFWFRGYECYFNSKTSNRGTGILTL